MKENKLIRMLRRSSKKLDYNNPKILTLFEWVQDRNEHCYGIYYIGSKKSKVQINRIKKAIDFRKEFSINDEEYLDSLINKNGTLYYFLHDDSRYRDFMFIPKDMNYLR